MKKHRRRIVVINKAVQSRIIMSISWPSTACLVFTAIVLALLCVNLSEEALALDVELPSVTPIFWATIGFVMVSGVFLLVSALRFSHRIAGPMYRMTRVLEAVRGGDLSTRARLRKGDLMTELADDLNEFLDWLEEHPPQNPESTAPAEAPAAAETAEPAR